MPVPVDGAQALLSGIAVVEGLAVPRRVVVSVAFGRPEVKSRLIVWGY